MTKEKRKSNNGITLIALIITIIVMLILVAVSVTVALNGGLFNTANKAKQGTTAERENELALSDGQIEIDGKTYASYQDYLDKKEMIILPKGWSVAETKPEGWSQNVIAITDGTNVVPLPNGFEVSTDKKEDSIEEGLVLKDGANEFVWIPVVNASSYTEGSFGPLEAIDYINDEHITDSQENLDYYYGTDYYDYDEFTYEMDKTNVETSIKKYGGFYVGRYETTYDSLDQNKVPQGIGVKLGKKVLPASDILKSETKYRWWGLYKVQKDIYADDEAVGSLMISSNQWDAIMTYTGYGSAKRAKETYGYGKSLAGSAYINDSTQYDVSKNIYDLAGNYNEWTLTVGGDDSRIARGGYSTASYSASNSMDDEPARIWSNLRF